MFFFETFMSWFWKDILSNHWTLNVNVRARKSNLIFLKLFYFLTLVLLKLYNMGVFYHRIDHQWIRIKWTGTICIKVFQVLKYQRYKYDYEPKSWTKSVLFILFLSWVKLLVSCHLHLFFAVVEIVARKDWVLLDYFVFLHNK